MSACFLLLWIRNAVAPLPWLWCGVMWCDVELRQFNLLRVWVRFVTLHRAENNSQLLIFGCISCLCPPPYVAEHVFWQIFYTSLLERRCWAEISRSPRPGVRVGLMVPFIASTFCPRARWPGCSGGSSAGSWLTGPVSISLAFQVFSPSPLKTSFSGKLGYLHVNLMWI